MQTHITLPARRGVSGRRSPRLRCGSRAAEPSDARPSERPTAPGWISQMSGQSQEFLKTQSQPQGE